MRVSGIDALPDNLVIPAHIVECSAAIEAVERAWRADRARQTRLPPSVEELEDDE